MHSTLYVQLFKVEVRESPDWIPSCELDPPTRNDMNDWMSISQRKTSISDETEFCSEKILHGVLTCKVRGYSKVIF